MSINKIRDEIYRADIHFLFDESEKAIADYAQSTTKEKINLDPPENAYSFHLNDKDDHFIVINENVIIKDKMKFYVILVHEALHVTSQILRSRGLELDDGSEEAFTYHLDWVIKNGMGFYKQKVPKMKAKAVSKKEFKKYIKADKKDDMKMIKAALKKKVKK